MGKYAHLAEFMKRVRWSNDHFEKHKNSSLHALIGVLDDGGGNAIKVATEVGKIPSAKALKYKDALYYLLGTYPNVRKDCVTWGDLGRMNAARFPKAALPRDYDGSKIVKGAPPTAFLNQSCEEFLLSDGGNNGVIIIHLGGFQPPMSTKYSGYTVEQHIASVLRVAADRDVDVCVLHMKKDTPVCQQLKPALDACRNKTIVYRSEGHMGTAKAAFKDFAKNHDACVVMGFDGTVCVHANIFGAPEKDNRGRALEPLITLTNVVTSRCVLVTSGELYPKNWQKEYGVLEGL